MKVLRLNKKIVSQCSSEFVVFLSPNIPDVKFHAVLSCFNLTQGGPRVDLFELKEEECGIEKVKLYKSTHIVNNI